MHDSIKQLIEEAKLPTTEQATQTEPITSDEPIVVKPTAEEKAEVKAAEKEAAQEAAEEIEVTAEMLQVGADTAVMFIDFLQQAGYTFWLKNKEDKRLIALYGENAITKLSELLDEQLAAKENKVSQTILREFTAAELGMLASYKNAQKILDSFPLSDNEKQSLIVPLMQMMKQSGATLSPQWSLLLAAAAIFGGRALNVIQH